MQANALLHHTKSKFLETGYHLIRRGIDPRLCEALKDSYYSDVKPYNGLLTRQQNAKMESHKLCSRGFVTNALLNVHNLPESTFPAFRQQLDALIAHDNLANLLEEHVGLHPIIVETMYFESSHGTYTHADSYFMDSRPSGAMVGAWLALEDIEQKDGCFFIYPRSHALNEAAKTKPYAEQLLKEFALYAPKNSLSPYNQSDVQYLNTAQKLRKILHTIIRNLNLQKLYLPMRKGDIILFHCNLLHGSSIPLAQRGTRNSLTLHAISNNCGFVTRNSNCQQFNTRFVGKTQVMQNQDTEPGCRIVAE